MPSPSLPCLCHSSSSSSSSQCDVIGRSCRLEVGADRRVSSFSKRHAAAWRSVVVCMAAACVVCVTIVTPTYLLCEIEFHLVLTAREPSPPRSATATWGVQREAECPTDGGRRAIINVTKTYDHRTSSVVPRRYGSR